MEAIPLAIPEIVLLKPKVFCDERGFFLESFNLETFEAVVGRRPDFVQDSHSLSVRGVLRGLHFQLPPKAQDKLVRVTRGEVFDVAVDVRRLSPSFGQWVGNRLSAENKHQVWIPAGFAHGFLVLSDVAELIYKATDYYSPEHERCIAWNDPEIAIDWPITGAPVLSPRDGAGRPLLEISFPPE